MTWNAITLMWMLLSAVGTVAITIGIAVWVLKHYNQDIKERQSVQQLEPDHDTASHDTASHDTASHDTASHGTASHDTFPHASHHDPTHTSR